MSFLGGLDFFLGILMHLRLGQICRPRPFFVGDLDNRGMLHTPGGARGSGSYCALPRGCFQQPDDLSRFTAFESDRFGPHSPCFTQFQDASCFQVTGRRQISA